MAIRIRPQDVVLDESAIQNQALQNQLAQLQGVRGMSQAVQQDLGQVMDYFDDKYLLDVLSQGGLDNAEAAQSFSTDFQGATPQTVGSIAQGRVDNAPAGVNMQDSAEIAQIAQQNPQLAMQAVNNISSIIADPRIQNYLARNPQRAAQTMGMFGIGKEGEMSEQMKARLKEDADVRKELRGDLRKRMGDLDKNINVLETNYKKIQNLSSEVEKGNRTAIAQTLVAMVKLNDPNSAVLNSEMEAALNTQNPAAAVADYLAGEGVSSGIVDAIVANVDPLSPKVVKVGDIMATANAMLSANAASMQANYQESKSLGDNLGATGIKSIFTKSREKRLDKLGQIGGKSGETGEKPVSSGQITVTTQEEVDNLPSGTVFFYQGEEYTKD